MSDTTGDVFALLVALLFIGVFCLYGNGCTCAGIGNVAKANQPYSGMAQETFPHVKVGPIHLRKVRCVEGKCTYLAGLRPYLHNPTGTVLPLKSMICTYYLHGKELGQSHEAKDVVVTSRSSRRVEGFDFFFDAATDKAVAVSVTCTANFGIGFPTAQDSRQLR